MMSAGSLRNIRELAYRLWEARGRRHGHAIDDWLDAERQLAATQSDAAALPAITRERPRKDSKAPSAANAPTVPIDEAVSKAPELPKVGSRDAPGG
jgi:hypothetical protein